MWNRELRRAHGAVAVPHDVQIERPRTPPHRPHAAALRFDAMQLPEQLARLERRLEQDHLVQVRSLRYGAEGRRLLDSGNAEQTRPGKPGQPGACVREVRGAVPHVGPEGHVDPFTRRHPGMLTVYAILANPRVSSRSIAATSSISWVARSSSDSPRAASLARVATSSASARFFPAIAATAWMRSRRRPKALSCSPAAAAMRCACAVASAVAATIASCTLAELSPTNVLSATSRSMAPRICWRLRLATSLAVLEAWAASVPSSDTRRDTWARLSVASSPPDTSPSSACTPSRITPVDWATALAASRIAFAARARVPSCWVSVSTVSTSGRRSSVMWIAVASWFAKVAMVTTSFDRYVLRL